VVVTKGELVHVTADVPLAGVVIDAVDAALQQGEEAFHGVGVARSRTYSLLECFTESCPFRCLPTPG
jgi:hypothetical protein